MLRYSLLFICVLFCNSNIYGWGKRGHDVICSIAEHHLEERVKSHITDLFDGYSMVYFSSWADGAKYTKEHSYTRTWHYINIEKGESTTTIERNKRGDVLSALVDLESQLRSGALTREKETVALKLYIHLMGDMHQPLHTGFAKDKGGSTTPVVYFTKSTTLHTAWDYDLVMGAHEWSYNEWQEQIDRLSRSKHRDVVKGSYEEWIDATHKIALQIYRDTPAESRIYYDYVIKYTPIIEQQLLYAALRLAYLLNDIYK